jgi:hypothetical protein
MNRKSHNALGWGNILNVFAATTWQDITIHILARNLIQPANNALAKSLCLCPQGQKNVGCIGW